VRTVRTPHLRMRQAPMRLNRTEVKPALSE
jgi:hypothetical protein